MALTVTTDLTIISTAETVTGWSNYGSGGAGATAVEPDYYAQGSNCISRGVTGAATNKGMCFDIGAGSVLNFTTTHAGKLFYIWIRDSTPGLTDTRANGGVRIVLGSGSTAPGDAAGVWSAWYVDGSDTLQGTDGWKIYVIDPTLPPSTTFGGGVDLTAVRWFGAVMRSTGTVKGQNFGVDQIAYGLGELRARGTNTTAGAGFKEISDADFGTIANRYGIVVEKEGIFFVTGKLVLGDGISTNTTDFTSENETVVWTRPTYYDGTREVPCVQDRNPQTGVAYFGLDVRGNGTGNTNVQFGQKVGSGDTATGRSGSTFIGSRGHVAFDFDDGNVENVLVYGSTFRRIRGGIDMSGNASTDEFIGNTVTGCGAFQAGPVKVRACNFVENVGGANKTFEDFQNDATSAEALATADPLKKWSNVLNGSNFSCPVKVPYVELLDPGASDRREVVQVEAIDSASLTVTVASAGGTYTRSAGSYLTDGFFVGQVVTWSGFTNAGNNATKTILALTATVMTVNNSGLVNETGDGDERVIDSTGVGSDDHYAECSVRWPSGGANQGSLGPTIRGAAGTTESYYYLKADLQNNQISLIRCDAGTDTTIDGPDSFTFAEDTDYTLHLRASGTTIEGFVNGLGSAKLSATGQSSYQTNRRVGIRGDAEADQTGDAPRLSRFGFGPNTDKLGALVVSSATDDFGYSNLINNMRALGLQTTGTYSSVNNNFVGNACDIRDDSGGSTTVDVTGTGGAPVLTRTEEIGAASTTINASVTLTVTVKDAAGAVLSGARVAIYTDNSGETELMNETTNGSGVATETYAYAGDQPIFVRVRHASGSPAYADVETSGTITSSGFTLEVTMQTDPNVS